MPTMGKIHPEDGITWFTGGEIDRHVGLGTGMRLNIGMFGAEQFLGTIDG